MSLDCDAVLVDSERTGVEVVATTGAAAVAESGVATAAGARIRREVQLLYLPALLLGHHTLQEVELGLLNEVLLGLVRQPEEPRP